MKKWIIVLVLTGFVLFSFGCDEPTAAERAAKNQRETDRTIKEMDALYETLADDTQEQFLIKKLSFIASDGEEERVRAIAELAIDDRRKFEEMMERLDEKE